MAAPFQGLDARGSFQSVMRGPSREEERSLLRRLARAGSRSGPRGGAELVPSEVASDSCSVSDSEQLLLASSVARDGGGGAVIA